MYGLTLHKYPTRGKEIAQLTQDQVMGNQITSRKQSNPGYQTIQGTSDTQETNRRRVQVVPRPIVRPVYPNQIPNDSTQDDNVLPPESNVVKLKLKARNRRP